MLNLLLANRLLAFFCLCSAIAVDRTDSRSATGSRVSDVAWGSAVAAWAVVGALIAPAFQLVMRLPDSALVVLDSRAPLVWLLAGILAFAIRHSMTPGAVDTRFSGAAILTALIATPAFPLAGFLAGGVHLFQPAEGVSGLLFLLYPTAVFSGRMGTVGRCLGIGLVALGFGAVPAVILSLSRASDCPTDRIGHILGSAAVGAGVLIGLEEFGGVSRAWSALIATGMFVLLSSIRSQRSTEVRAS